MKKKILGRLHLIRKIVYCPQLATLLIVQPESTHNGEEDDPTSHGE